MFLRQIMSLPGKVISIDGDHLVVEVTPKPECNGCHACTGLLGGEKKSAPKKIDALKGDFSPQIGDEVILDVNPGEGSIAAILVFGTPMLTFFAGLFAAPWIAETLNFQLNDPARLLCAFIGLAAGFAALAVISRSRAAKKLTLKVVEIATNSQNQG